METRYRVIGAVLLIASLLGALTKVEESLAEQEYARVITLLVPFTEYQWWLIRFQDNQIQCVVLTDHEGLPTQEEAIRYCGYDLAYTWLATPPCVLNEKKTSTLQCEGVYLQLIASQSKEREVVIELPLPEVWVNLEGCEPTPPENRCPTLPILTLTGEEPLPNERITAIQGFVGGEPFVCEGEICRIPLRATPIEGTRLEFWANSSYGDSSEIFSALIRVVDTGVSTSPEGGGWFVDVISSQWKGAPLASCTRMWEAFPPIGGPPAWLATPEHHALIASEEPYYYLAGRLISQGLVDVSTCPAGGLLPNGYADVCGLEKARPLVAQWQNQFDERLTAVANETGVPSQLMKNLFAQESQFWPGIFRVPYELGLGQITDKGTDVIFIWNPIFYEQFCPLVLSQEACDRGYLNLGPDEQTILRGALALQAKADCEDCPMGIDLSNTNYSIMLFANTLIANCAQVSRTIYNATANLPGAVSSYEDLWRFTVANYHAGPGCLAYAIHQAWQNTATLSWEETAKYFTDPCKGVIPYVEKISQSP